MSSGHKVILSDLISFLYVKVPVIGLFFILSVFTQAHAQDFYSPDSPPTGQVRYRNIREGVKVGNYSLAENLIQDEWNTRQGDPELEYYQVNLWLRKANDLYEKEQYKSALDYYMNVYRYWPNHPTVRERIERWKNKKPFNKTIQPYKSNLKPEKTTQGEPMSSIENIYDNKLNMDILLLKDRLDSNNERLETFLSIVYIVLGFLIAVCILLIGITIKLSGNPKSNPSGKIVSGGNI